MKHSAMMIVGTTRPVDIPEPGDDFEAIAREIFSHGLIAIDTETTGLDHFAPDFRVRTVQFGSKDKAWVFKVEESPELYNAAQLVLDRLPRLVAHNMTYDALALDRCGVSSLEAIWDRSDDTILMAHLLDPRSKLDGGSGHSLEALAARYVGDPDADRFNKRLKEEFRKNKWKVNEGYARIPLDNDAFIQYAAADVFLAAWLYDAISPMARARFADLYEFELNVARICSKMQRRGIQVDTAYATEYGDWLTERATAAAESVRKYGVEKVNSNAQVAEALLGLGVKLTHKTPKGAWQVNKEVLEGIIDDPSNPRAQQVATDVLMAKSSGKFRTTYVDSVVAALDSRDRVHPHIHSLQARTARMSISNPPLQQIPSGDWRTRRLYIAEEGNVIGASDYSQIELRMVGLLANEKNMLAAVLAGIDLHTLTAERTGLPRKLAKMVNFLIVYGGGAKSLARKAGITLAEAQAAVSSFKRAYPAVTRYARRIIDQSEMGKNSVTTLTGRELPLDRNRVFAGVNYVVQSSARDVLAQALINLEEAGLEQYLLLPVHDEVVFEAPQADAEDVARAIGETMTMTIGDMPFEAEGEVYGASWGHGYMDEDKEYESKFYKA